MITFVLITLTTFSLVLLIAFINIFSKYKKYKKASYTKDEYENLQNSYNSIKQTYNEFVNSLKKQPLRHGYYDITLKLEKSGKSFVPRVYVQELDRYINGESEIKIQKINPNLSHYDVSHDLIFQYIKDNFSTVKKTSDITWLESEVDIKEQRKEKINHILKTIKENEGGI